VYISWTPPHANGAAILNYSILVQAGNGTFINALPDCDGTNAAVISKASCNLYNVTMRASPLSLTKGQNIVVKVNAANLKGYNASYSIPNSPNHTVEAEPVAGAVITRNQPPTTYNLLNINIPVLTGTSSVGGPTVTISSYHVQMD